MSFIPPMQACAADIEKVRAKYADGLYTMEPKLDGWRAIAHRNSVDGPIEMYTRTGHTLHEKVPHIIDELQEIPGPWVLDGEIGYVSCYFYDWPVLDYNRTARVLGSDIDVAITKQVNAPGDPMKYFIFDEIIPDETFVQRHGTDLWMGLLQRSEWHVRLLEGQGWDENVYNRYVEAGGEGIMLKHLDSLYHPGKRPANQWIKLKKFETTSALITGYIEGQGKYDHLIGAICFVSQDGVPGKCSGMTDEQRIEITEHASEYIDKHIEIKHYGMVGRGETGYRHPQFLRFRLDLDEH